MLLLQGDGITNGAVLEFAKSIGIDALLGEGSASREQLWRAKEAADVVGAEWRAGALGHSRDCIGDLTS